MLFPLIQLFSDAFIIAQNYLGFFVMYYVQCIEGVAKYPMSGGKRSLETLVQFIRPAFLVARDIARIINVY